MNNLAGVEVLGSFIRRLLRNRDFLGLQLDLAYGNIDEEEFETLSEDYLKKDNRTMEELISYCHVLFQVLPGCYDSDTLSLILGCDECYASQAIIAIERETNKQ